MLETYSSSEAVLLAHVEPGHNVLMLLRSEGTLVS
jgi:hypothetical protein